MQINSMKISKSLFFCIAYNKSVNYSKHKKFSNNVYLPCKKISHRMQTTESEFYFHKEPVSHCSPFPLQVYVSTSLANLYESIGKDDWRLVYTGIPVLLHDKGCTRSRCTPRVSFVLAERGTCFALWKDTIDNLSDYKVAAAAFHTMCLSAGRWIIALSLLFLCFS